MEITIGDYLIKRLKEIGVDDIFGVPGDFVLGFMEQIIADKSINLINTCNELNAAYAADGYARIKGVGCVCTTYGVGELSAINGVAGSFAERIPVINITGAPSTDAQTRNLKLHHTTGDFTTTRKMFDLITAYSTSLTNEFTAIEEIDKCLTICLTKQLPVYISIPTDIIHKKCKSPSGKLKAIEPKSDPTALEESIEEVLQMINKSSKPLIIADAEIQRYKLVKEFSNLLDKSGLPFTVLMMGKTIVDEEHPQFIGLYMGDRSRKPVIDRVAKADCVIEIGLVKSDLNTGGFSINIDSSKEVQVMYDRVRIKNHYYENVFMKDFMIQLAKKIKKLDGSTLDIHTAVDGCTFRRSEAFKCEKERKLEVSRFFDKMAHFIPENAVVIADTGVSLFAAAEVLLPKGSKFIGQVYYGSIGFSVGATLGVCVAVKNTNRKVILFVGDGSFQVTAQDLSSMMRYSLSPTVFLLNNDGYTIERLIIDGPYNDIQPWKYHKIPEAFGGSGGYEAHTEGALEVILQHAKEKDNQLSFIEIHLDRWDSTNALKEAGKSMAKQNQVFVNK